MGLVEEAADERVDGRRAVLEPGPGWLVTGGGRGCLAGQPAHRNWPAEVSGSLSHTTATTSPGSITAHPVSRSRRTRPSGRTSTPVSFLFSVAMNPTGPILPATMEIDPDLPMRGLSRSRIVSPVIGHHLRRSLRAGCPRGQVVMCIRWARADSDS